MKKIKVFLFIILLIVIIILTYNLLNNNKKNLLVIGNNLTKEEVKYYDYIKLYFEDKNILKSYDFSYTKESYLIKDLTKDIYNNNKVYVSKEEHNIKQLLGHSNIIIVSIGNNEIINNYKDIDNLLIDIEKLIKQINIYKRGKIYFLSFYDCSYNKYIDYANNKLKQILIDDNINYIDINTIISKSNECIEINNLSLTLNKKVSNQIIKKLEKDLSN